MGLQSSAARHSQPPGDAVLIIERMDGRIKMSSIRNQIFGAIIGLCVGDALGVPYEFHGRDELPPKTSIEYTPPKGFNRAHVGVPPGTWSDDSAQALCLLASLIHCGKFDAADFAHRLVNWRDKGYMAVDAKVFDVGITTNHALSNIRSGVAPLSAGPSAESDNGNGSLMRVLPLALWHKGSDSELVRDARLQSRVTHGHLRSQLCCALYCLWARRTLENVSSPWNSAVESLKEILAPEPPALNELELSILTSNRTTVNGSGYVVDCLMSARWAMEQRTYEEVVLAAIALGNDTDTTASVAGGIAGVRGGLDEIPLRWREGLRDRAIVEDMSNELVAHLSTLEDRS